MTPREFAAVPVYRALIAAPLAVTGVVAAVVGVAAVVAAPTGFQAPAGVLAAAGSGWTVWRALWTVRPTRRRTACDVVWDWVDAVADWGGLRVYDVDGHEAGRSRAEAAARTALVDDMLTAYGDATGWTAAMWDEFAARSDVLRAAHTSTVRDLRGGDR